MYSNTNNNNNDTNYNIIKNSSNKDFNLLKLLCFSSSALETLVKITKKNPSKY